MAALALQEDMHARMTNMGEAFPDEEFEHHEVQTKLIMRTPSPSQQLDHKFGVDNFHTPKSKDQCFATNLVDRFGNNEARVPNSRPMISPMVSAILDELTETASSILAEDDAGLALLDSQIEKARNLNSGFKHVVLPRLHVSSSDLLSKSGDAAGASNLKGSFFGTTSQAIEKSPGCHDLNASECLELCAEEETQEVNLIPNNFSASFEEGDDNPLQRRDSEVANLRHRYNASNFSSEECKPLHTTTDFLPFATPKRLKHALQLLNSSNSRRISLNQAHECNRSISGEIRSSFPIAEDSDVDISSGLVDAQHEDEGLRWNCRDSSEGCRLNKSRRWWDTGRYLPVRLASMNLCWYGEILLGGTLCVVLTLPLAVALAKVLTSPPDYLIPT